MKYYKIGNHVLASEGTYELESTTGIRHKVKYSNLNQRCEFRFKDDVFFLLSYGANDSLHEISEEEFWKEMEDNLIESGQRVYDSHVKANGGAFLLDTSFDNARDSFVKKTGIDRMEFIHEHVYKNRPEIK
jgi:hypothetical protein